MTRRDPYRYFRIEALELLAELQKGALQLEGQGAADAVSRMLRVAHTLKGAARVVRVGSVAEHAHAVEDALAPLRDGALAPTGEHVRAVLRHVDAIEAELGALLGATAPGAPSAEGGEVATPTWQAPGFDPSEVDALVDDLQALEGPLSTLRQLAPQAERARHTAELLVEHLAAPGAPGPGVRALADDLRELVVRLERVATSGMELLERELTAAVEAGEQVRLVPASALLGTLERVAWDTARALDREVAFAGDADAVRLDPKLLARVQAGLVQAVRNAVAHGIEPAAEREAAGKPRQGTVRVEIRREGERVRFSCRDDGRGIDGARVRAAARRRGLEPPADDRGLLRLLLGGGLSTASDLTQVSGRGVGLDVARSAAEELGGDALLDSTPGAGATLSLRVPVSRSAVPALLVEVAGVIAAIPTAAVRGTIRLPAGATAVVASGASLRVVPLADLLRVAARAPSAAVVVESSGRSVAVGVDRPLGLATVVVRNLPAFAAVDRLVAGVATTGAGAPRLVLDAAGLVEAAAVARTLPVAAPPPRLPVLVVDDSLTTRMLEQSLLESAGYEVHLATSGEEGLDMARQRPYGLFLVDVEMPGIDGFTFVERTRAEPTLGRTPAILVTSRSSPEDRARGAAAGAAGYVVKSEFDQAAFLERVGALFRGAS